MIAHSSPSVDLGLTADKSAEKQKNVCGVSAIQETGAVQL